MLSRCLNLDSKIPNKKPYTAFQSDYKRVWYNVTSTLNGNVFKRVENRRELTVAMRNPENTQ